MSSHRVANGRLCSLILSVSAVAAVPAVPGYADDSPSAAPPSELAPGLQTTGGVSSGPIGPDEVACSIDSGRELWIELMLRPLEWL